MGNACKDILFTHTHTHTHTVPDWAKTTLSSNTSTDLHRRYPVTAKWLVYIPPGLTSRKILHSAQHGVFVCFVWISEKTAIISLYNINWLVFITETECLLRGMDWIFIYIYIIYIYIKGWATGLVINRLVSYAQIFCVVWHFYCIHSCIFVHTLVILNKLHFVRCIDVLVLAFQTLSF